MSPESNTSTTLRGEPDDFAAGRREERTSSGEADERESTDVLRASRVAAEAAAVATTTSVSAAGCDEADAPKFCLDAGLGDTSLLLHWEEEGREN
jgi:hypothetical protein